MAAINSEKIGHGDNLAPGQTFTFTWNNPPWGKVVSYVAFPAVKSPGRGQVRRDAGRGDRRARGLRGGRRQLQRQLAEGVDRHPQLRQRGHGVGPLRELAQLSRPPYSPTPLRVLAVHGAAGAKARSNSAVSPQTDTCV